MKHHLFQYEFCATKNQKSRSSIGHQNICNITKDQLDFKIDFPYACSCLPRSRSWVVILENNFFQKSWMASHAMKSPRN